MKTTHTHNPPKGFFVLLLLMTCMSLAMAAPMCSDGIDNDGDGKIDALVEDFIGTQVNRTETKAFTSSERGVIARQITVDYDLLTANEPDPLGYCGFRPDTTTQDAFCREAGYDRSTKQITTRKFTSCHDNCMAYFDAAKDTFKSFPACQENLKINTITCERTVTEQTGPACSDGIDNDGDGKIDYPQDPGCASEDDTDERPHDPDCTDPNDPDEGSTKQCNDAKDNDNDGLIDAADPGCWDDPTKPSTYNPQGNNEARYDIACTTNTDCGADVFFGNVCQEADVYKLIFKQTCNKPGTGLSFCSTTSVFDFVKSCAYGCTDGSCETGQCTKDTDCGSDTYSNPYCGTDGNVYKTFSDVSCNTQHMCVEDTSEVLVTTCPFTCSNGACSGQCNLDSDCGNDYYGDNYCGQDGNVYRDFFEYTCASHMCAVAKTTTELVSTCQDGCANATCINVVDTTGPTVTLTDPTNGATVSGDVTFSYTAVDDTSGVAHCSLHINDTKIATDNTIVSGTNTFVRAFNTTDVYYTAQIRCVDGKGNSGSSMTITFFYAGLMCQDAFDCGSEQETFFCSGDDLMKEVQTPICTLTSSCSVNTSTVFVRTCIDGCLNNRCLSDSHDDDDDDDGGPNNHDDDDDDRDRDEIDTPTYDDDTNALKIFRQNNQNQFNLLNRNETIGLGQQTQVLGAAQDESGINWWMILLIILVLAILIVLIAIIFYATRA